MPHLATDKKSKYGKWAGFSVARKVVKSGDLVESWDFLDAGFRRGMVPQRRSFEKRVRRDDNNLRAKRKVCWLIEANGKGANCYFFTATFADEVVNYGTAMETWERFRRLLVTEFPDVRYVGVFEVQKKRLEKTGKAVWHFHAALIGLPPVSEMRVRYGKMTSQHGQEVDAWMFHFTKMWMTACRSEVVNRVKTEVVRSMKRLTHYVAKYITKETGAFIPPDRRCFVAGGKGLRRPIIIESRVLFMDIYGKPKSPVKPPYPAKPPEWGFSRKDKYQGRTTYQRWRLDGKESDDYERNLINVPEADKVSAPSGTPADGCAQELHFDNPI